MVLDLIHVYDLSIVYQFLNIFGSSIFLHWCWCYSYRLTMDESWLQTNVKCCVESAIIHSIFSVMYGKNSVCSGSYGNKKANVMDNVCIQLIEQFECCCLTLKKIGRVILMSDLS
jgi:hypothetical protein